MISFPLGIYPEWRLLGHRTLHSVFCNSSISLAYIPNQYTIVRFLTGIIVMEVATDTSPYSWSFVCLL